MTYDTKNFHNRNKRLVFHKKVGMYRFQIDNGNLSSLSITTFYKFCPAGGTHLLPAMSHRPQCQKTKTGRHRFSKRSIESGKGLRH